MTRIGKSLFLLIFYLTPISFVQGQMACHLVHADLSVDTISFDPLKQLSAASEKLLKELGKKDLSEISKPQLQQELWALEKWTETYLRAAGFTFKPRPMKISHLKIKYKVYEVEGRHSGDEISQMFYQARRRNPLDSRKFLIDPLFQLRIPGADSGVDPVTKDVQISVRSLLFKVATLKDDLAHEFVHYDQDTKLLQGEHTLARLILQDYENSGGGHYSGAFRLDELEAHLVELRGFLDSAKIQTRETKFLKLSSMEKLTENRLVRKSIAESQLATIRELLEASKRRIQDFQKLIESSSNVVAHPSKPGSPEARAFMMSLSPGTYRALKIDLSHILSPAALRDQKEVQAATQAVLRWSLQRIHQIESEISTL